MGVLPVGSCDTVLPESVTLSRAGLALDGGSQCLLCD